MNHLRKSQKQLLNKIQDDSLFHLHRSFPFVLSFPPSFSLTNIHAIDSILFHSYWFSVIFFYNIQSLRSIQSAVQISVNHLMSYKFIASFYCYHLGMILLEHHQNYYYYQ